MLQMCIKMYSGDTKTWRNDRKICVVIGYKKQPRVFTCYIMSIIIFITGRSIFSYLILASAIIRRLSVLQVHQTAKG
jgi:hypothetical protein